MRFIIISFIISLLSLPFSTKAQEVYHVIHVKGSIQNSAGKSLKAGDKISSQEKIKFANKEALAVVIGTQKGRMVIMPPNNTIKKESELVFLAKNVILPFKTNSKLSTRGQEEPEVIDFNNYFGSENFAIIGDKLSLKVSTSFYPPQNGEQFFIYTYKWDNKVIQKKIYFDGNKITFDKNNLYTVENTFVNPEAVDQVNLYFFNATTKYAKKVATFKPVFIEENTLKNELYALKNVFKAYTWEQLQEEFYTFIGEVYGNTDKTTLENWAKETLVINK